MLPAASTAVLASGAPTVLADAASALGRRHGGATLHVGVVVVVVLPQVGSMGGSSNGSDDDDCRGGDRANALWGQPRAARERFGDSEDEDDNVVITAVVRGKKRKRQTELTEFRGKVYDDMG